MKKEKNCFNCNHHGPCHARVMLDNAFSSHLDFNNQEARRWTWAIFGYMAEGCLFYSQKKESDATNTK